MAKSRKKAAKATAGGAADAVRHAWQQAMKALVSTEREVEKQVRAALKRNKISGKDAASVLKGLGARFEKEREKTGRKLAAQIATLQARVKRERKAAGKRATHAVQQGLAALNIPSRREVSELTQKVEQLSRKIDALKRRKK
jgi:polyhydroxyalkanoate synthesis regulator phasin